MASNGRFPRFPKPFQITAGPFVGINDTPALSAQDGTRATAITNGYIPVPGGDVVSRAGFQRIALSFTGTGTASITGGTTLNGFGTSFDTQLATGDLVTVGASATVVVSVTNPTQAVVLTTTNQTAQAFTVNVGGAVGPLYAVFDHTRTDGTEHRFILAGANNPPYSGGAASSYSFTSGGSPNALRLLEYTPGNTPAVVSQTSTTMNGKAFAISQRQYLLSFANYLIMADGVHQPWKVDCTSAPYVLSALTDMTDPVYARPTVYYGKLFFILASDRITLVWSEEADPDLGYQNSSYSDSWELRQTSPEGLTAIEGTNVALYVFRQNSITAITGAVNTDFASAGTQEAISTTTGTESPDAVVTVGDSVFFLDSLCRPHVIDPGRGVVPLYGRITQTLGMNPPTSASQLQKAWGRVVTSLTGNPLIVWCFPLTQSATTQSAMLVFDAYTRECVGQWVLASSCNATYGGIIKDSTNAPRLMIVSGTASDLAVYYLRAESDGSVYLDALANGTTVPVQLLVTTPKVAGDPQIEKLYTRIDLTSENISGTASTMTAAYQSARSAGFSSSAAMDALNVTTGFPNHWARMTDLRGRWAQYQFASSSAVNARASVGQVVIEGVAYQDSPTGVA